MALSVFILPQILHTLQCINPIYGTALRSGSCRAPSASQTARFVHEERQRRIHIRSIREKDGDLGFHTPQNRAWAAECHHRYAGADHGPAEDQHGRHFPEPEEVKCIILRGHRTRQEERGDVVCRILQKTGLTASSLFRLEQGQQSITLGRLHEVLKRLKATLGDVFDGVKG